LTDSQEQEALLDRASRQLFAGQSGAALGSLEGFLSANGQRLDAGQLAICEKILDREFEHSRARVLPLYRRLVALGSRRQQSVMITLECVLNEGDLRACAELLGFLGEPDAAWEHRILARYFLAAGDSERAARHFLAAGRKRRDHFPVVMEMIEHLLRLGSQATALSLADEARGCLAPAERALLELRIAELRPDVVPDLAAACSSAYAADAGLFLRYLRCAADQVPRERLEAAYSCLAQRFPEDATLLGGIATLESERRNFSAAQEWLQRALQRAREGAELANLRFQQLQLSCQTGRYAEARAVAETLTLGELKPLQQLYIGRLFAELGEWDRALDILAQALPQLEELDDSSVSLIARVGRRSRGQLVLLRGLAAGARQTSASRQRVATALYEDWITGEGLDHPEAAQLARLLGLAATELMTLKLGVLAPRRMAELGIAGGAAPAARRAVFYCADGAYLLPALVSLASLLHHNRGFDADDFYLVASGELAGAAADVIEALARHFGVKVQLLPASELQHEAGVLRPSFAAFTGGNWLSEAAYYRIYMARKLALSGSYDQLLYVDSDSVVSHGFDAIVDLAVNASSLLMARIDADLPGVRVAIRRFGLKEGRYFNSGVLWFPHVNQRLIECLEATIRVALERNSELMFLDQCALNVAFADAFEPLPARFNFFAGPEKIREYLETPAAEACFIHMLNRIKPWDSAYPAGSPIQRRWISELRALQRIVGAAALRPFLSTRA
jgi:lipopolysaccharide biosynthesis glycosyltransferase